MQDTRLPYDLEFLLRAAPFSEEAKGAVDVIARRMKAVSEFQLQVASERLKRKDAAAVADQEDAVDQDLR